MQTTTLMFCHLGRSSQYLSQIRGTWCEMKKIYSDMFNAKPQESTHRSAWKVQETCLRLSMLWFSRSKIGTGHPNQVLNQVLQLIVDAVDSHLLKDLIRSITSYPSCCSFRVTATCNPPLWSTSGVHSHISGLQLSPVTGQGSLNHSLLTRGFKAAQSHLTLWYPQQASMHTGPVSVQCSLSENNDNVFTSSYKLTHSCF